MFRTILAAYDGSDHADAALTTACNVARTYGAALHIVHVPEVHDQAIAVGSGAVTIPVTEEEIHKRGAPVMAQAVARAEAEGLAPTGTDVLHGPAAEAILGKARDSGADLIVMGRRGRGNLAGLLLGSVSTKLSALADCAVLTVK